MNDKEELVPYRPLCADRLKISGCGQWDPTPYLSDLFYLPFVEPRCNEFEVEAPRHQRPDLFAVDVEEVKALCLKWDERGLLELLPKEVGFPDQSRFVKVFNNYKSALADRQIGDRRSQNYAEGRIPGPSVSLPTAAELLQVQPRRYVDALTVSITDRRDFYHQFYVTSERASRNAVYPWFPASDFSTTKAFEVFKSSFCKRKRKQKREEEGDYLLGRGRPRPLLVPEEGEIIACFKALFQGDHLGVEIACDSHSSLLETHGLLCEEGRLRSDMAIEDDQLVQGLVIDDFFAIATDPVDFIEEGKTSQSVQCLRTAKEIYRKENIMGSDDKDVVGQQRAKVCGAELDSSLDLVKKGVVGLGAPLEKRLALAMLSAACARVPYTTDAVHSSLVGSWISVMMLRRPCMSILNEVFRVSPPVALDTTRPKMWSLGRKAADELLVAAALAPIMVSNLAVPFKEEIFATDSSSTKGGIGSTEVPLGLSKILVADSWEESKEYPNEPCNFGGSSAAWWDVWAGGGALWFFRWRARVVWSEGWWGSPPHWTSLSVCGGVRRVRSCDPTACIAWGHLRPNFGPVSFQAVQFDLSKNPDVGPLHAQGRLDSFLVAPPCTSFSPAAYPPVRSYAVPRGFKPWLPKVWLGNRLAFGAIVLLQGALRYKKFGLGEQPRRSKMRWLAEWRALLRAGASEAVVASCGFGSIHQKEFAFVGANMLMEKLERKCTRDHSHVPIQGKFTRPSSVYVPKLAKFLAKFMQSHLEALEAAKKRLEVQTEGLEDVLSNDVLVSANWKEVSSWSWSGSSHINVLETSAVLKLFKKVALDGGDCRLTYFIDSHVGKSALCRGRSASASLQPLLKRACSWCLSFGLYPAGRFSPTRYNPADHPTRNKQIPEATASSL